VPALLVVLLALLGWQALLAHARPGLRYRQPLPLCVLLRHLHAHVSPQQPPPDARCWYVSQSVCRSLSLSLSRVSVWPPARLSVSRYRQGSVDLRLLDGLVLWPLLVLPGAALGRPCHLGLALGDQGQGCQAHGPAHQVLPRVSGLYTSLDFAPPSPPGFGSAALSCAVAVVTFVIRN